MNFEWDEEKNKANIIKHGVSFYEAESVFDDLHALVMDDISHSDNEERFLILGFSNNANLLMVCHCYRRKDTVIRIISARKATNNEKKVYSGDY